MTDVPGRLWAVIQEWLDTFRYRPPSQNELAPRFGTTPSSLTDYKYARTMPPPHVVFLIAQEIQVPYERVLDAVLEDHGYRGDRLQALRAERAGYTHAMDAAASAEADEAMRHIYGARGQRKSAQPQDVTQDDAGLTGS